MPRRPGAPVPPGRPSKPAFTWWPAAALIAAVIAVYANSLSGAFVLDDQAAIVTNATIRDVSRPAVILMPAPDSPVAGRPLANLTFALNYAWGGLDVTGYHIVNIALHAVCAVLLMIVIRRTMSRPTMPGLLRDHAVVVSFAGALLWAVHPLNSEVVDYVSQRTESLMALCFLSTLYSAIRAHETHRRGWDGAAVAACALGMMSKEAMVTAPVVIALYDRVFLFDSWRALARDRTRLYAGLAATWLLLAALLAGSPRAAVAGFSAGVPVWSNLLNQAVLIVRYLRLTVWPSDLVALYGWHEVLTLGDVLPQALLVVALLVATIVALWRVPAIGFAGAWLFITLAPSSSIVPIATEVGAERRMYLPSAALAVLLVSIMLVALSKATRGRPRQALVPIVILLAAALGVRTYMRNQEYASGLTLAQTIVERRPTGVAYQLLGEELRTAGRESEAIDPLREAVRRGNSRANFALGASHLNRREHAQAIERLDAFVNTSGQRLVPRWLEPSAREVVAARMFIGEASLGLRDANRAAAEAETILREFPRHVEAHALLGAARFAQQRWPEAIAAYRVYLAARPSDVLALINFGVASVATGAMDNAVTAFERASSLDPRNERARQLLGMAVRDRELLGAAR